MEENLSIQLPAVSLYSFTSFVLITECDFVFIMIKWLRMIMT